jgi:hypothetical protein
MQSGGPSYMVPLGRRDSTSFATQQDVLSGLVRPTAAVLSKINLVATDLVGRSQRDFFDQFAFSVVKMGQIKVLTGAQGQIRPQRRRRRHAAVVHRRGGREPRVLGVAAASGCRGLVWIGLAISPAADSFLVGSN